jgi:hypothetical protein
VAAEAEQVERTRRKTLSRARSEVFVPYTVACRIQASSKLRNPLSHDVFRELTLGGGAKRNEDFGLDVTASISRQLDDQIINVCVCFSGKGDWDRAFSRKLQR